MTVDGDPGREPQPGLLVGVGLYSCDYLLTQVTARLYHGRAKQKIVLEGSFELNPLFERMSTP
jgi:hypothetical protein